MAAVWRSSIKRCSVMRPDQTADLGACLLCPLEHAEEIAGIVRVGDNI